MKLFLPKIYWKKNYVLNVQLLETVKKENGELISIFTRSLTAAQQNQKK